LTAGERLFAANKGVLKRLPGRVPVEAELRVADKIGRLLGIDEEGRLVRWSSKHGLRALVGKELEQHAEE
jgi:hypothetical protein